MTETLLEQLHERGRLHVVLSSEASIESHVSLDGSGAVLFLGASGRPVQLLLDDYVDPEEDREVHFALVTFTLRWRDDELLVHGAAGTGAIDPWSARPARAPRRVGDR